LKKLFSIFTCSLSSRSSSVSSLVCTAGSLSLLRCSSSLFSRLGFFWSLRFFFPWSFVFLSFFFSYHLLNPIIDYYHLLLMDPTYLFSMPKNQKKPTNVAIMTKAMTIVNQSIMFCFLIYFVIYLMTWILFLCTLTLTQHTQVIDLEK